MVTGLVIQGRLQVRINYQAGCYRAETMEQLSKAYEQVLTELIDYCCRQSISQKTPSDFTYKELSLDELDSIMSAYK
jgi:surfactin family lipopeptide synthetase A